MIFFFIIYVIPFKTSFPLDFLLGNNIKKLLRVIETRTENLPIYKPDLNCKYLLFYTNFEFSKLFVEISDLKFGNFGFRKPRNLCIDINFKTAIN